MSDELQTSVLSSVGYLHLNRPEFHNAVTKEMWLDIPLVLNRLRDEGARCVVISGRGRSFSSGANLDELAALRDIPSAEELWHAIRDALSFVSEFELPVIANINGACIGGGCLLACACDIRIASNRASFGVPTSKLGLLLDDQTVSRMVSLVGPSGAKLLLMTGMILTAEEAENFKLVDVVLDAEKVETFIFQISSAIVQNEPNAVRFAKQAVNRVRKGIDSDPSERDEEIVRAYLSQSFRDRLAKLREY